MNEEIYAFGEKKGLVGIVSHPLKKEIDDLPAVILLNAGFLHKVGPYRLNVDLARRLASKGFTSFRFDMSGIGDSEKKDLTKTAMERAVVHIKETMDFLEDTKGLKRFVLVGLCSGADQSHPVAASDQRISGAVFLDGCGYRTKRYYVHYYAKRAMRGAFKIGKWKTFIRKKIDNNNKKEMIDVTNIYDRRFPEQEKAREDILSMVNRGVNLLYVYTGGIQGYYTYYSQFEDMFGIKVKETNGRIDLKFFEDADHIYTMVEDRGKLIGAISDWMQYHYSIKQ